MPDTSGTMGVLDVFQGFVGGDGGGRTVVAPEAAGLRVATEIEGCEFDVADRELFGGGVESGLQDSYAVVLEHVQESSSVSL